MTELPSGTVTFLFTDVEGSTRLLADFGAEGYAAALLAHRRVIRQAAAAHGGVEVDTQGDAFFVAFPNADGALDAAERMTSELAEGPIRVRIGLHTGTPLVTSEGYVGADIHRAARIAAAGHGGQVLVSTTTAAFVDGDRLKYLGEHRFKDLAAPERVFQLGTARHPPLKSLFATNLPVQATHFIGREEEVSAVAALLTVGSARVLTLTGPGGSGKTRLALEVAGRVGDAFPHGVWWVPLAALRDPQEVVPAMLNAAGTKGDSISALGGRRMLLVLDNAEHLLPRLTATLVELMLVQGPQLLVTSRQRLGIRGEQLWSIPPLADEDGEALFVARARALDPDFNDGQAVGELCRQLENMPLALELAAARTRLYSPKQLLERLSQRLDLLKAGDDADPRQRTLRATIDWSHDLLSDEERQLFRNLAIFIGGFTIEAAEQVAVADADTLESLVDKSLVRMRDASQRRRFALLETIREYAQEKLDGGERASMADRHARYFAQLADQLEDGSLTSEAADLEAEVPNLRSAAAWARTRGDGALMARILTGPRDVEFRHEASAARAALEEALRLGIDDPLLRARALSGIAFAAYRQGDARAARAAAEEAEALARRAGDDDLVGQALMMVAAAEAADGRLDQAATRLEEAVEAFRGTGSAMWMARAVANLGDVALAARNLEQAHELSTRAIEMFDAAGEPDEALTARVNRAAVAALRGERDEAWSEVSACLPRLMEQQDRYGFACALQAAALVRATEGRPGEAARLLGASDAIRKSLGAALEPSNRIVNERVLELAGDTEAYALGRTLSDEQAAAMVLQG